MTAVLAPRGPDDHGVCFFPENRVGLGHRRLSIIDLSPAGHQPMATEDGAIWIALNGEIYNFLELRAELEAGGCRFRSESDTEVLLELYARQGTDCFRRLNGMFAVAILDRGRRKMVLARDHFGVKPLYYHHAAGRLVFGSEIKAILASGAYATDVNWQAVSDYLTYLYVPCPETIFRDVLQVPPAHVLEYDLATRQTAMWPYWELPADERSAGDGRPEDDCVQLRALLTDSVKRQMISDVPLGIFLSGGVDSRILTGLMAQASSRPVKSFTVVFEGKHVDAYDERRGARATAERFGTEHHELTVDITAPTDILGLVRHFDQPFGNPTAYLMYLIARHTRREVTVALSGAGGDELFAGYPRYRAASLARWALRVPGPLRRAARRALELLPDDRRGGRRHRMRRFLSGLDHDFATQFVKWTYFLNEEDKARLLAASRPLGMPGALAADRIVRRHLESSRLADPGNRMLYADVQTFLVNNILEYTDKRTMAVGLEGRVPYLDPRVVEHSMRVPFSSKLHRGRTKLILRQTFADLLDEPGRNDDKRGFNAPLGVWVRDVLDDYFDEHMGREPVSTHGIFDWERIQALRQQHRRAERDNSYELFAIIMFDVWFRGYVLGAKVEAVAAR